MVKQTAGRDALHDFAPKFAELNDDVLFGEVWSREGQLPLKLRSIVTITALISKGITDSSLTYHLTTAKQNGVTKAEMAELLTHLAFYAGWPNAWAAFRQAKEVYADGSADANGGLFGLGEPNTAYAQYFTGESFLNPLTDPTKTVFLANVTFSPACRNNWHIHHAKSGGGQLLLCAAAGRVGQPVLVRRLQIGRDRAVVDDEVRNVLHIFHVHIELRIDAQDELLGIVRGAIQQLARRDADGHIGHHACDDQDQQHEQRRDPRADRMPGKELLLFVHFSASLYCFGVMPVRRRKVSEK